MFTSDLTYTCQQCQEKYPLKDLVLYSLRTRIFQCLSCRHTLKVKENVNLTLCPLVPNAVLYCFVFNWFMQSNTKCVACYQDLLDSRFTEGIAINLDCDI